MYNFEFYDFVMIMRIAWEDMSLVQMSPYHFTTGANLGHRTLLTGHNIAIARKQALTTRS